MEFNQINELNKYKNKLISINEEINNLSNNNKKEILYYKKLKKYLNELNNLKDKINYYKSNIKRQKLFGYLLEVLFVAIIILSFIILKLNVANIFLISSICILLFPAIDRICFRKYYAIKNFLEYNDIVEVEKEIENRKKEKELYKKKRFLNGKKIENLLIEKSSVSKEIEGLLVKKINISDNKNRPINKNDYYELINENDYKRKNKKLIKLKKQKYSI